MTSIYEQKFKFGQKTEFLTLLAWKSYWSNYESFRRTQIYSARSLVRKIIFFDRKCFRFGDVLKVSKMWRDLDVGAKSQKMAARVKLFASRDFGSKFGTLKGLLNIKFTLQSNRPFFKMLENRIREPKHPKICRRNKCQNAKPIPTPLID